jgi:transmembrane sensor
MTNPSRPDPDAAAAAWYARTSNEGRGASDGDSFDRWMDEDPANERAWEKLQDTNAALESLRGDPRLDAMLAEARAPLRPRRSMLAYAAAAAVAVSAGIGALTLVQRPAPVATRAAVAMRYATAPATIRTVSLPDGSIVTIDAASAIAADPAGRSTRGVTLLAGRALFAVAKDKAHPFVVTAGSATVTALGTHFSVEQRDRATIVALTEGSVRVTAPAGQRVLRPGQVLSVSDGALSITDNSADAESAWQQGRLEFSSVPLGQVVATLNRYDKRRIVIADAALAAHPFSGSLKTSGGTDALIAALEAYRLARVASRRPDRIDLVPR